MAFPTSPLGQQIGFSYDRNKNDTGKKNKYYVLERIIYSFKLHDTNNIMKKYRKPKPIEQVKIS